MKYVARRDFPAGRLFWSIAEDLDGSVAFRRINAIFKKVDYNKPGRKENKIILYF
jgi:hypothetical protein